MIDQEIYSAAISEELENCIQTAESMMIMFQDADEPERTYAAYLIVEALKCRRKEKT